MKRLLDFEEMNDLLSSFINIKKCEPIGFTNFGYPIDHYCYGNGNNHVIITGGTHASELISNIFVIRFMEKLSKGEISIDTDLYTLDFIPFVNPDGTIIVTNAIRSLIPRDISDDVLETYLLTFYRNSYIEGDYANKYGDRDIKLQEWMFRYSSPSDLDGDLGRSVSDLFEKYNLPRGCMINWSSNGRGVDLNSNIECGEFLDRVKNGEEVYAGLHLNTIKRNLPGPVGCPYFDTPGEIEPENKALLNFYSYIKDNYNLIGSFIYHSCGNIVYYLSLADEENPWKKDFGKDDIDKNFLVASKYADTCGYKLDGMDRYTTMDSKLKTLFPVTLLIELGSVRGHPLAQFMDLEIEGSDEDFKNVYSRIIEDNTRAILNTIPLMLDVSKRG
ncbi:MAG: hypothetical protein IKF91_05865 [Bacilli bacterium]|nr:hypothetical protein [Bacilli bacterium]